MGRSIAFACRSKSTKWAFSKSSEVAEGLWDEEFIDMMVCQRAEQIWRDAGA